jgi:hypothetical protein
MDDTLQQMKDMANKVLAKIHGTMAVGGLKPKKGSD